MVVGQPAIVGRIPQPSPFASAFRAAAFRASASRAAALVALIGLMPFAPASAADPSSQLAKTLISQGAPLSADTNAANPPIEGRVDPDTYRVGPGDEFAFRHSDLLDTTILRVGPAGEMLLPDAGAVMVAGLTLREAEAKIRESLRAYVRGKGLVFTLYRPRRFRLPVLGEVQRPGVVTLSAPARASEAIDAAGGIADRGARRGIVIRRGADSLRVDLDRYANAGDMTGNPLVFESDVIFVPALGPRILIYGAVAHSGSYEFVAGDRVSVLVSLAGGSRPEAALDQAELERFDLQGGSTRTPVRLRGILASPGGGDDLALQDGDRLFIPALAHYEQGSIVSVEGEVQRPGPYAIRDGLDGIRSVLERAGGLTEFADPLLARVERRFGSIAGDTTFLRLGSEHGDFLSESERGYVKVRAREREAVSVDLSNAGQDIALLDGDRVIVPRRSLAISVQGEVRSPGLMPYEAGRGVSDYIRAAGGFTGRAHRGRVLVTPARTDHPINASEAGVLHPGDTVWVPAKTEHGAWGVLRDVITTTAQIATVYLVVREATK